MYVDRLFRYLLSPGQLLWERFGNSRFQFGWGHGTQTKFLGLRITLFCSVLASQTPLFSLTNRGVCSIAVTASTDKKKAFLSPKLVYDAPSQIENGGN